MKWQENVAVLDEVVIREYRVKGQPQQPKGCLWRILNENRLEKCSKSHLFCAFPKRFSFNLHSNPIFHQDLDIPRDLLRNPRITTSSNTGYNPQAYSAYLLEPADSNKNLQ